MYIKKNGKYCKREAIKGYSYCKQHVNIILKQTGMQRLPRNHNNMFMGPMNPMMNPMVNPMMNPMVNPVMNPMVNPVMNPDMVSVDKSKLSKDKIIKLILMCDPRLTEKELRDYPLDSLIKLITY